MQIAEPIAPQIDVVKSALYPWQSEPYRLWSLLYMIEEFPISKLGSFLTDFERTMAGLEAYMEPPKNEADVQSFMRLAVPNFQRTLTGVLHACKEGHVPLSRAVRMQIQDFITRLPQRTLSSERAVIAEHARLTRKAILNDLSDHLFLYVDGESSEFYTQPLLGWEQVIERFGCSFDVEEARKCSALGRYTACVFHLMKVVEAAVLELQMFLKDKDVKAHFGSVLAKLEDMTQKTRYEHIPPHLQPYLPFLREVLTQLHAVKDSWRNKVSHVDAHIVPVDTFTQELAKGVHDATLLLMKKLATGLPR